MNPELFEALREGAAAQRGRRDATDREANDFRRQVVRFLRELDEDTLSIPVLDLIEALEGGE